jgi:hypothetical protein
MGRSYMAAYRVCPVLLTFGHYRDSSPDYQKLSAEIEPPPPTHEEVRGGLPS